MLNDNVSVYFLCKLKCLIIFYGVIRWYAKYAFAVALSSLNFECVIDFFYWIIYQKEKNSSNEYFVLLSASMKGH